MIYTESFMYVPCYHPIYACKEERFDVVVKLRSKLILEFGFQYEKC